MEVKEGRIKEGRKKEQIKEETERGGKGYGRRKEKNHGKKER